MFPILSRNSPATCCLDVPSPNQDAIARHHQRDILFLKCGNPEVKLYLSLSLQDGPFPGILALLNHLMNRSHWCYITSFLSEVILGPCCFVQIGFPGKTILWVRIQRWGKPTIPGPRGLRLGQGVTLTTHGGLGVTSSRLRRVTCLGATGSQCQKIQGHEDQPFEDPWDWYTLTTYLP